MLTNFFDYKLPRILIAQTPAQSRDSSRLLVFERKSEKIIHDYFYNLPKYLSQNDVLVFNDSKVFPARLMMQKETGGRVEVFLLRDLGKGRWKCLLGGKIKQNQELRIKNRNTKTQKTPFNSIQGGQKALKHLNTKTLKHLYASVVRHLPNNNWIIRFNLTGKKFEDFLNQYGQTPTPPYIKTKDSKLIRARYQTVYAKHTGSVAAPTAGLHFTKQLLNKLNKKFVQQEFITLHIGQGTFMPVKSDNIEEHKMHREYAVTDKKTIKRLNKAKHEGKRIIAVGTTSLRALESASKDKKLKSINNWINLFIYLGYKFKFVDCLITNFHLPKSSLLMLVSAMMPGENNIEKIKMLKKIYNQAIKKKYKFYSFGDAMLIH